MQMQEDKNKPMSSQSDPYRIHCESCKECQGFSPCKVGHDILLESVGWKGIKDNV
jgi:hypothetical protein